MPKGVRNSIWAVFFLAGMAFMATLVFMLRPDVFSSSGVREKPGSSILLVGSSDPEPSLTDAQTDTVETPPTPLPQIVANPKQTPAPPTPEQRRIARPEQTPQINPEAIMAEELPRTQVAAVSEARNMVAIQRRVHSGRTVF